MSETGAQTKGGGEWLAPRLVERGQGQDTRGKFTHRRGSTNPPGSREEMSRRESQEEGEEGEEGEEEEGQQIQLPWTSEDVRAHGVQNNKLARSPQAQAPAPVVLYREVCRACTFSGMRERGPGLHGKRLKFAPAVLYCTVQYCHVLSCPVLSHPACVARSFLVDGSLHGWAPVTDCC